MQDDERHRKDASGLPVPDPPEGGPNRDDDSPDPADLAPGFGGTSRTRPPSTDEDEDEPTG
ncbi:hypothetical protein B0I33_11592 [Prauserella shujinwangii]|uniref:Uncharacterized protein n=1 Tax=Prauserella shujinwangii TaxID=1453103 RepID=A0A2T0LKP7_9PSEU|nr:hypothetical protein [Prauserella shujinwangii]PRX43474.1 hypothetical protein B0I33_11592 [Prauserella shujinwangii]